MVADGVAVRAVTGDSVMAAAALATGAGFKVAFLGNAAEFESLAHVLGDGFLDLLHFLLRIEEAAGDRIVQEGFAQFFKGGDFALGERRAGVLLFVQEFALGHQGLVVAAGLVIGHEGFNILAEGADVRLIKDGLAKFLGLLNDSGFFGLGVHNVSVFPAAGVMVFSNRRDNTPHDGGFGKEANLRMRVDFRVSRREGLAVTEIVGTLNR
jgi:hypothetical protein